MIYTWRCCEVFCGGKKERKYKRAEITLKNGSLSGGKEDEKKMKKLEFLMPMCLYSHSRSSLLVYNEKYKKKELDKGICLMSPQRKKMYLMKHG
jgi:hypothetical protein